MKVSLKRRLARMEPRRDPAKEIGQLYYRLIKKMPCEDRERVHVIAERWSHNPTVKWCEMDKADREELMSIR